MNDKKHNGLNLLGNMNRSQEGKQQKILKRKNY